MGGAVDVRPVRSAGRMALKLYVALAIVGAVLVAVGAGLIFLPVGLIVAGGESLAGAYVGVYLQAKGSAA